MNALSVFTTPPRPGGRRSRGILALLLLIAGGASAEVNPYFIGLTESIGHYSNLLGVAVVVEPNDFQAPLDKWDRVVVTVVVDLGEIVGRNVERSHPTTRIAVQAKEFSYMIWRQRFTPNLPTPSILAGV